MLGCRHGQDKGVAAKKKWKKVAEEKLVRPRKFPRGVLKKNCMGRLKVDFRILTISINLKKRDFVPHHYIKLLQIHPILQIGS